MWKFFSRRHKVPFRILPPSPKLSLLTDELKMFKDNLEINVTKTKKNSMSLFMQSKQYPAGQY